jgi:chemotaxis signal transduction protein
VDGVHVRVRVGGEQYALAVAHVQEVLGLGELSAVPGSAPSMLGLRNLAGEILPVFDLASVLQIEGDGQPKRLVVLEHATKRAAFAVDEVLEVGQLVGERQASESPHLRSSLVVDSTLIGVIDVGVLLDMVGQVGGEIAQ